MGEQSKKPKSRRRSIVVGVVALLFACCGITAVITTNQNRQRSENPTLMPTTAVPESIATSEPTNTAVPTDTPQPTATSTPVPTDTAVPTNTMAPTATQAPLPTQPLPVDTPAPALPANCTCTGQDLNCDDFNGHRPAQACFDYCVAQGFGDVYRLDGDNDGSVCEG